MQDFLSIILCKRNPKDVFLNKRCVGGRRCHECGNLALFHRNLPIDPTHFGLSDITITWKRYEYVTIDVSSSSSTSSKRINLLEDNFYSIFHGEVSKSD